MEPYMIDEKDYKLLDLPSAPYSYEDMPENTRELYLLMYSLYSNYLTQYLMRNTDIASFDKEVQSYPDFIDPVFEGEKDVYQLLAGDSLKYLYVRNNLYLHRLTSEEMKFLASKIQTGKFDYDASIESFIAKTYGKVIAEEVKTNNTLVNFGPIQDKFFAPPNALVIGFRCDDTLDYNKVCKQQQMLGDFQQRVAQSLSQKLNHSVSVIKYNRMSVKKKIVEGSQKR